MLAGGHSNAELARRRGSPRRRRSHMSPRLLGTLGPSSRAQVVVLAYETGIVRPGEPNALP